MHCRSSGKDEGYSVGAYNTMVRYDVKAQCGPSDSLHLAPLLSLLTTVSRREGDEGPYTLASI